MIDSRNYSATEKLEAPEQVRDGSAQSNFDSGALLQEGNRLNLFNRSSGAVDTFGLAPASQLLGTESSIVASGSDGKTEDQDMVRRVRDSQNDHLRRLMDKGKA